MIDLNYIENQYKRACKILKLKKIPSLKLEFLRKKDNTYYNTIYNVIGLNLNQMEDIKTKMLPYIKINLSTDKDIILFSLYHELAHCLQKQKFEKWLSKFIKEYSLIETHFILERDREYRKLKVEKNADKIAIILFKKLESEVNWND
jgi:hypothetical protein